MLPRQNGNPTLFDLMKMGAKVEFGDGSYMRGISGGYIGVGNEFGSYGQWPLTREGLIDAIIDLKKQGNHGGRN
jgi:hypothetical protein